VIVTVTLNASVDRTLGLDTFRRSPVLQTRLLRLIPDGKGVNVSVSLASLGLTSVATGVVGLADLPAYRRYLSERSIRCRLVPAPIRTRMNTTLLWARPSPGELHLRELGDPLPRASRLELRKTLARLAGPRTTFVFSGSTPPGLSHKDFVSILRLAGSGSSTVCVDSSGPGLRAALQAGVSLIKPNDEELAELTGMPTRSLPQALDAAESLLPRIETLLVTRGSQGALLVNRLGAWNASVRLPRGCAVNSVGAGDAFLAGWLLARSRNLSPERCLASAVAAGAANALEQTAGKISAPNFRKLLKAVVVKTL